MLGINDALLVAAMDARKDIQKISIVKSKPIYQQIQDNVKRINSGSPAVSRAVVMASQAPPHPPLVGRTDHLYSKSQPIKCKITAATIKTATDTTTTSMADNRWWAKSFDEKKGDSSKIITISDSEDDEDYKPLVIDWKPSPLPATSTSCKTYKTIDPKTYVVHHHKSEWEPKMESITDSPKTTDLPFDISKAYSWRRPPLRRGRPPMHEMDREGTREANRRSAYKCRLKRKALDAFQTEMRSKHMTDLDDIEKSVSIADPLSPLKSLLTIKTVKYNNEKEIKPIDRYQVKYELNRQKLTQELQQRQQKLKQELSSLQQSTLSSQSSLIGKQFCIFCPHMSVTADEAKQHLMSHLDVCIECGECHEKFTSLNTYRQHNEKHLDRNKMLYLDEFMAAKKWSDTYVDYTIKPRIATDMVVTNCMFCPVCRTVKRLGLNKGSCDRPKGPSVKSAYKSAKDQLLDEEFVRNHLHQHLQYLPYVCIDCDMDDKKTEFCLNDTARQHLRKEHSVHRAYQLTAKELMTYYDRKKPIKKLDYFIDQCLATSLSMKLMAQKSRHKCPKKDIFVNKNLLK